MTSAISVMAKLLAVKEMTIKNVVTKVALKTKDGPSFYQEQWHVEVAPYKREQGKCPCCGNKCPGYDTKTPDGDSTWRGPNLVGAPVFIHYTPKRIKCPEHGVLTEKLPWTDGNTRSLKAFNDEVTFLTLSGNRSMVAEYMDVNWRTIGNCLKATHDRIEPNIENRLRKVRRICVDETSRKKGHKYITVVIDMDRNQVIWIHDGHGLEVFKKFCESLTPEEQNALEIIAGDGAKWIDECKKMYFPNAVRCIDPFHVITWVNKALDDVRIACAAKAIKDFNRENEAAHEEALEQQKAWLEEYERYKDAVEELANLQPRRGRKSNKIRGLQEFVAQFEADYGETMEILAKAKEAPLTEVQKARLKELEAKAKNVKGCKYALGMNPENLSNYNFEKLELLKVSNPDLYRAYELKERIRVIIHMTNRELAEKELDKWIEDAISSGFPAFKKLAEKIKARKGEILNSIEYGENSAKSEQTNGKIKHLIHTAHGFRNLDNMFALIYLSCSDLVIPLPNRYRPSLETIRAKREKEKERIRARQEAKVRAQEAKKAMGI